MFKRIPWKTGWPTSLCSNASAGVVYIGMGVNIGTHGQRVRLLLTAVRKINSLPATRVLAISSLYETPPWGFLEQEPFYNGAIAIRTGLAPVALLHALKSLEVALGRKRRKRWGPREIDLDVLIAGKLRLRNDGLTIPHPELTNRSFAMIPILELNPKASLPSGLKLRHSVV